MSDIGSVSREMNKARQKGARWREIGKQFGITAGMAYRIAVDGYEPKRPDIRFRLGLPAYAPAPVCPKCGEVHVTSRCVKNRKPRKPFQLWLHDEALLEWALRGGNLEDYRTAGR